MAWSVSHKKRLCLAPNWKDKKVIDFDLRKKNSGSSSCLEILKDKLDCQKAWNASILVSAKLF